MKLMRDNLIEMSRKDLDAMARAAWAVVDHPEGLTQEQLDANDELLYDLEIVICFGPEWSGVLVPLGFDLLWKGFYPEMVEVFLTDVGEEVCEQHSLLVAMARQAAEACDYQGYGTEYKLDMLDSLNKILAQLWEAKERLTEVVDDDVGDRVLDEIERRVKANFRRWSNWSGDKTKGVEAQCE